MGMRNVSLHYPFHLHFMPLHLRDLRTNKDRSISVPPNNVNVFFLDLFSSVKDLYIIEFKVSEDPDDEKSLPLQQIKSRGYSEKYVDKQKTVYLIGMTFSKKDRNISSFEWEKA